MAYNCSPSAAIYRSCSTSYIREGFVYRPGSWKVMSDINGKVSIPEPIYASPAVWNVGDLSKDEVLTLTLIADIVSTQDPVGVSVNLLPPNA